MDKTMHLSEKMTMENNSANQESNGEKFVHKVASSGLVLKFKVDKYGTPPSNKHTILPQEVMMSGGKQNVMELLYNSEANSSTNAIPLLEQSEISATEGTRSNKISLFDKAKVAPPDEIDNTAAMVKLVHKCNECGKGFQEITSLHGHKGVHRREEYKHKRMMLEQQPITVDASHVVSSQKTQGTKKDEIKKTRFAAQTLEMLSIEFKRHQQDDLSASMIFSNMHISAGEETDEMKEVAEILVTLLAQSFCKDSIMHVASSSSIGKRFVCTTCKKVFSSYHGLGGHMSIHKPTKNSLLEDGSTGSSGGGREQSIWKYVCDKCNMKFPTGQILGGHKRGHWWEEYYKSMALLGDGNVKPPLPKLPRHERERLRQAVVPTDKNIQPAGTGLVVAAHTVPMACDGVQQSQQAMSLGNEIELPVPSGVSYEDIA